MRITPKNIVFVKEHMTKGHNPNSVFAVMVEEGSEFELKEYSLFNLPKAVKKWVADTKHEVWESSWKGTTFTTYFWKR